VKGNKPRKHKYSSGRKATDKPTANYNHTFRS